MEIHIILAVVEGCAPSRLDDPLELERLLGRMVEAAEFTLFDIRVHRFHPHGVTAAAIVGESHIALHTWPEEGSLFVDIASCTTMEATERAMAVVEEAFPRVRVSRLVTRFASGTDFQDGIHEVKGARE